MICYEKLRECMLTTNREQQILKVARREQELPTPYGLDELYRQANNKNIAAYELECRLEGDPELRTEHVQKTIADLTQEGHDLIQRAKQKPSEEFQRYVQEAEAIRLSIPERALDGRAIAYNLGLYVVSLACTAIFLPFSLGGISYRPELEKKPIFKPRSANASKILRM